MGHIFAGFCGRAQPRPPAAGDTSEAHVFRRSRNGLRPDPRLPAEPAEGESLSHVLGKFRFTGA